jgi:hypothetical protein
MFTVPVTGPSAAFTAFTVAVNVTELRLGTGLADDVKDTVTSAALASEDSISNAAIKQLNNGMGTFLILVIILLPEYIFYMPSEHYT